MSSTGVAIEDLDQVTKTVIGCAIEVHTQLGPGLLENTYEQALAIEFEQAGMKFPETRRRASDLQGPTNWRASPGFARRRRDRCRNQER